MPDDEARRQLVRHAAIPIGVDVALIIHSRTGARIAGGSPTAAEVREARRSGITTLRLDTASFDRAGADMQWVTDIPTLRTVFLHERVKTPDLASMAGATVNELCVWTPGATPVSGEEIGWLCRIDCEAASFVTDGWRHLAGVVTLHVGRVTDPDVRIGDGCHQLTFLKLRGRSQTARLAWEQPPASLGTFMTHSLRWRDLDDLARCPHLTSVQVYNSAVDIHQGTIDISAFAQTPTLRELHLAENLPLRGVPAVLAEAPDVTVHVARDLHDAPDDADRIHRIAVPIKKHRPLTP